MVARASACHRTSAGHASTRYSTLPCARTRPPSVWRRARPRLTTLHVRAACVAIFCVPVCVTVCVAFRVAVCVTVQAIIVNAEERHGISARPPVPQLPPPAPPPAGGASATGGGGGGGGGAAPKAVTFRGRPSRVLLLKNMVGPGEVDADLSAEIGEECSKYGEVLKVTVYELPAADNPDPEKAVRIFVQFAKQGSTMKVRVPLVVCRVPLPVPLVPMQRMPPAPMQRTPHASCAARRSEEPCSSTDRLYLG